MNLSILFWFYKDVDVCKNRLQLLKKYNPDSKVYGLFGGDQKDVEIFKNELGTLLDDFYVSPFEDPDWKWINGDLMILDWYLNRGNTLDWDSVVLAQWDMLVFDSLKNQFPGLQKDQIFFSGLRTLDENTESRWDWTSTPEDRPNYLRFVTYIENTYGYTDRCLATLFIMQVFPRLFFEKYAEVKDREIGMLEYKIPTYAKIFNIPFYEKDLGVNWFETEPKPMNAIPEEIERTYILDELSKESGWRLFHPYYKVWHD
jgi:hypothetical protein